MSNNIEEEALIRETQSQDNSKVQAAKIEPSSAGQMSIEDLLRANAQQQRAAEAKALSNPAAASVTTSSSQNLQPAKDVSLERAVQSKGLPPSKNYNLPHQITPQPQHQSQTASQVSAQRQSAPKTYASKNYLERSAGIKVVGIGGAGCNAIERMIEEGVSGVEFIAINTDAQALSLNHATTKIVIGEKVTKGRGAGSDPEMGRKAIEQNIEEIKSRLTGADLVFITAGMGGGTGTGAAPIVADISKKAGALTVAVVTKPFPFEGSHRMKIAREGIFELSSKVDTLITVPNDKLLSIANKDLTLLNAFRKVDDVLSGGVKGITDIILQTGVINVDFADIQSILLNGGASQVGIGKASGQDRSVMAAQNAIFSPLLETSIDGAKAILFNVTGDSSMSLYEVKSAADIIFNAADSEARIVFGYVIDETITSGEICITVIATGLTTDTEREAIALSARNQETADILGYNNQSSSPQFSSPADDMDVPAILRRNKMKQFS